jgi:nucleotidyltransferase/DNA polymerase involved in DNA repair
MTHSNRIPHEFGMPTNGPQPIFAALKIPQASAQALALVKPELRGQAFAVIEQHESRHKTRVLAASAQAWILGIRPGTPVFVVKKRNAQVTLLPRDPMAEASLRARLERWLGDLTPVFEISPRRIGADLTGTPLARRFGSSARYSPWQALAYALHAQLKSLGFEQAAVGLASTRLVAQLLARSVGGDGAHYCAPGSEAAALAPLHPDCLPGLSPTTRELLNKLQLTRLDQITAFDCSELVARFGREGEGLHRMAQGLDLEVTLSRKPNIQVETVLPLNENDDDRLREAAHLTADKLALALRVQKAAADRITVQLIYSDGKETSGTVSLARATALFAALRDPVLQTFTRLHQRRVALSRIRLRVSTPRPESPQLDLFDDRQTLRQQALSDAVTRIRTKRSFDAIVSGINVAPSSEMRR